MASSPTEVNKDRPSEVQKLDLARGGQKPKVEEIRDSMPYVTPFQIQRQNSDEAIEI